MLKYYCKVFFVENKINWFSNNFSFNYNFGHLGILDWLHGTDSLYKKSVESQRDGRLYTLKSAREVFPPKTKEKVKWWWYCLFLRKILYMISQIKYILLCLIIDLFPLGTTIFNTLFKNWSFIIDSCHNRSVWELKLFRSQNHQFDSRQI